MRSNTTPCSFVLGRTKLLLTESKRNFWRGRTVLDYSQVHQRIFVFLPPTSVTEEEVAPSSLAASRLLHMLLKNDVFAFKNYTKGQTVSGSFGDDKCGLSWFSWRWGTYEWGSVKEIRSSHFISFLLFYLKFKIILL